MFDKYLLQSQKLVDQGRSFVVALVVSYQGPISGKPGDRAIVTDDGKLWGWVAGGCSQSIIVEEALNVLKSGKPRLIRITASPDSTNDNLIQHKMTCHSGGTLDVYLEPVVPKPQVIVLGSSVVAQKLEPLVNALDYQVLTRLDITKMTKQENIYIVVSTQGDGDEAALEQAIATNPRYIGFVASKKKAAAIKKILLQKGLPQSKLDLIKAPAGLDIKARTPQEIALSILAEIVMAARQETVSQEDVEIPVKIDPICGMKVNPETAKHVYEYMEATYYFCCEGCKQTFSQAPEKFLTDSV